MVAALNVVRNAKYGFGLATLLTAGVVAFFVLGPIFFLPGTTRPIYLYGALAFVLLVSLGGLLTALFTVISAIRLARSAP